MLRRRVSAVLVLLLMVAAAPLCAAETALDAVTTDASIVVRLKNPKATIEKVASFVDQVMPGQGQMVRAQAAMIGAGISNPTLTGVNMEGDWHIAVYATGGDQPPDVVFIIPATDLKAMKGALDDSFKFIEHGKLGVYTADAAAADKTAARVKGQGKSIATLVEKESNTVFEQGDVSVFINVAQLITAYKPQITESRERITQTLENLPEEGPPGMAGFNPKAIFGMLTEVGNAILQGLDDTKSCTISLNISKDGLVFEDLVRVNAGSSTDKFFQKSPPATLAGLTVLPAASLAYVGLQGDFSSLASFSTKMMEGMLEGNEEASKQFQAAMAEMQKLKFGAMLASFSLGDLESGAIRSVSVTEVDKPAKMREISQQMYKALGSLETPGIKQTYKLDVDAEKYGKNSADVMTVTMEMPDVGDPNIATMMDRMMKSIYGPDGMMTRMVYLKDKMVQTMGGGKDAMSKALERLDQKPTGDNAKGPFQSTRGKLSPKANLVGLLDLPGTLTKVLELVAESGMLPPIIPITPELIKGIEVKPSFLGLSLGTEPQGLRVKTVVPVEQVQGMARIVQTFTALQAGFGGAPQVEEN